MIKCNLILKTKLSRRSMTSATNSYAIPTLVYSCGIIKWTYTELNGLNRNIRVNFASHRTHYLRILVEELFKIIDIRKMYYKQIEQLRQFFYEAKTRSNLHPAKAFAAIAVSTDMHQPSSALPHKEHRLDVKKNQYLDQITMVA